MAYEVWKMVATSSDDEHELGIFTHRKLAEIALFEYCDNHGDELVFNKFTDDAVYYDLNFKNHNPKLCVEYIVSIKKHKLDAFTPQSLDFSRD